MALIIRGKSRCPLCNSTLGQKDPLVAFSPFLPDSHPLARFSDAAFHRACLEKDRHADAVMKLHERYQKIWRGRPTHLRGEALARWIQSALRGAAVRDGRDGLFRDGR